MAFTVGIAGITGKVALCVVQQLLKHPHVNIKGYCRDPTKLPLPVSSNPHVAVVKGQTDDKTALRTFVKGCDVVICCYLAENEVMVDAQKLLIDLCVEEGVERYIPSEYTLEYPSLKPGMFVKKDPILRIKEYLDTKDIKSVHVLVGMFTETLFSDLFYFWDPKTKTFRYYGSGDETMELTTYFTTGQYVAALALDREAVGFFRFLGDRRSANQIISDYEEVYGTEPAVERLGSLEDLYKEANETGEQDYIKTGAYLISTGQVFLKQPLDAGRYPDIKPVTVKDFFKQNPADKLTQALENVGSSLKWD